MGHVSPASRGLVLVPARLRRTRTPVPSGGRWDASGCRLNWSPAQPSSALRAAPCPAVLPEELLSSWYNCYKRFGFLIATLSPTPTRTPTHSLAARPRFMSNYVADCVKLAGHANTASTGQRSSTRDRPRFVCANVCTNCLSPDKRLPGAQHGVLLPACSPCCLWRVSFIVVWFCFAYDLHEIRFARLRLRGPDRE